MTVNVQDKPTTVANAATIKESIAAFTKGDLDRVVGFYAEDAETLDPTGKYKGKAQIRASFKVWHDAFPDAKGDVTNQISEGSQVLSEVMFRGTHTGPLAGAMGVIPPTGKPVELRIAIVSWFRDGKVQRERSYFDLNTLTTQLGLAKPQS
jgi:steroid delta-isomerase-like uncharacterized protein